MFKKLLYGLIITFSLVNMNASNAVAADNSCIVLGGTALANAVDSTHLIASLSGAFAGGAKAEILAETKTPTGLSLKMEHFFFSEKGGLLRTKDVATLTNVQGRENIYMLEINYDIQDSAGAFEGYGGSFQSFGLFDLNKGQAAIRYKGEICK